MCIIITKYYTQYLITERYKCIFYFATGLARAPDCALLSAFIETNMNYTLIHVSIFVCTIIKILHASALSAVIFPSLAIGVPFYLCFVFCIYICATIRMLCVLPFSTFPLLSLSLGHRAFEAVPK